MLTLPNGWDFFVNVNDISAFHGDDGPALDGTMGTRVYLAGGREMLVQQAPGVVHGMIREASTDDANQVMGEAVTKFGYYLPEKFSHQEDA